ncbi:type III-B CRISPR-associated protein Cas10/Cmr2, partial [Frankia sp. CIT1]
MADGYVMLTLGGVQEFIAASRRTADLWTASRLMSRLCQVAVRGVTDGNGEPVLPAVADVPDGLPNRIFAVVPAGGARRLAERVARDVHAEWDALRTVTFTSVDDETRTSLDTFPVVRWVVWE